MLNFNQFVEATNNISIPAGLKLKIESEFKKQFPKGTIEVIKAPNGKGAFVKFYPPLAANQFPEDAISIVMYKLSDDGKYTIDSISGPKVLITPKGGQKTSSINVPFNKVVVDSSNKVVSELGSLFKKLKEVVDKHK